MPRTSWARCWLEGAGAAILMAPGLIWSELSPTHIDAYHRLLPLTTVARALAVDLVLLSLPGMLIARGLEALTTRRTGASLNGRRNLFPLLWAGWLGFLAASGADGLMFSQILTWEYLSVQAVFFLAAELLFAVWIVSPRRYGRTIRVLRLGLQLLGICVFWMVPVLVGTSLAHQPYDEANFEKPLPARPGPHRRIVWLLFDGMSYYQVFDHRWPGLKMPEFDKLRGEAVTFSDVQPNGAFSEDVIPSLFLGQAVATSRATPAGWMIYRSRSDAPWRSFDGNQTLIADAEREGWRTGVSGWYNPYCRLLAAQLDWCRMELLSLPDGFSRDKSTVANAFAPLASKWMPRESGGSDTPKPSANQLDNMVLMQPGDALIGDLQIDLCFIHLPVPHPPGHYDRKTGKIVAGGSYIDNLALSDQVLGRMLADIAKSGAEDRTTLIVSSDHSWRVWLWRHGFGWTAEDEAASRRGYFDPRPMLMVRFPGETVSDTISRPVPLIGMHDLMERLMSGHVSNAEQLETWAAR